MFDCVWHKALLLKFKSVGLIGSLLGWFQNVLSACKTRGSSIWVSINASVPQGSRTTFIPYLYNDIVKEINSIIRLFADDTCRYIIVDSPEEAAHTINHDLTKISAWAAKCLLYILIQIRPKHTTVS